MRRSRQVTIREKITAQRISAVFSAVLVTISLVTLFYQPPVEAGVTTWPSGGLGVDEISTGAGHTCAISGGAVYCWGANMAGQLGNNSTDESLEPVAVDTSGVLAGKTVTAVDASPYFHTCAVADGKAYCWGDGDFGKLGDGLYDSSLVPVAVDTSGVLAGKTVTAIEAGDTSTCAIADGVPYCWGDGWWGQLGNNSTDDSLVPVAVDTSGVLAGKTVTDLSLGTQHACVVASGAAYCWGDNWLGQLGNDSAVQANVPVAVDTSGVLSGKTVTDISVGGNVSCAVADGQAYCWGGGYLGDGTSDDSLVPVAVDTSGVLSGKIVTNISVGNSSCVIADGTTYCWGWSIGDGTSGTSLTPVNISSTGALAGKEVTGISGSGHTCAIADGQVYCWGSNMYGQLGDGTKTDQLAPAGVQMTTPPLNASSYRLYENANSATPGSPLANVNSSSQLATSGEAFRLRQGVDNSFKTGMTAITAGDSHTCGVAYGQAYCWGGNGYGQLGSNSTAQSNVPVTVDASGTLSGKTVTAISAGNHHTCAIADGQAYCWGYNGYGQLGDNSTTTSNVPVAVSTAGELSGKTVTAIFASHSHTCAIADGAAYCWGRNNSGQLGDNSTTTSNVPVAVSTAGELSGKTVTALTGGYFYTCVIADGAAYCWGTNYIGMLGNNSYASSSVPVAVDTSGALSGKNITAISASGEHTCAIADGQAYCWGYNGNGQLGNDDTYDSPVPVAVSTVGVLAGKTVTTISAGDYHSCVIADGAAYCWGYNSDGQLGDNSTDQRNVPVAVSTAGELSGKTVITITASFFQTCAITDGAAYCWGANASGQLGNNSTTQSLVAVAVDVSGILGGEEGGVAAISAGGNHSCAISGGRAYCWGKNSYGQLGNNSTAQSNVPAAVYATGVLAGKIVTAVTAPVDDTIAHSCAIADGAAYCWGDNTSGQLGNNSTTSSNVPVAVSTSGVLAGKTITAITAGAAHTCAIADGKAYCWGDNTYGSLGVASPAQSSVPVAVNTSGVLSGKTATTISAGAYHTCVIADGKAYCWGFGMMGQLGNNSTASSAVPVAVTTSGVLSGKTVTAISSDTVYTCVIADGAAYCWGSNTYGNLGNNSTSPSNVPVAVDTSGVLAGKTLTAISSKSGHVCTIASGAAYCWGYNSNGQLGNNSVSHSFVPVTVSTSGILAGKSVTDISAGGIHTCAIADGAVYCWGANTNGQLGDNSTTQRPVAVAVDATLLGGGGSESPFLGPTILAGANTFVLQFTELSAAGCSLQTTGYSAVTGSTAIAYNTNAGVANGAAITTNANDPTDNAKTTPLTYRSAAGAFTNAVDIPPGNTGLFDFSLKDNGATANTTYCLRIAYADGSPIENATAYAEITTANGMLLIEMVDGADNLVASPSFSMTSTTAKTACQSVSGSFGTSSQRIRIFNSLSSTGWSANTSATSGPTAAWSSGGSSYDFNDPSGSPSGCNSGSDGDGIAGRLTLNPSLSTLTPQSGCSITGLSKGSSAGFSQGVLDAVTLLSASTATPMNCYYYITGVDMLQYIPANQPPGSYTINLTTTVVAQ